MSRRNITAICCIISASTMCADLSAVSVARKMLIPTYGGGYVGTTWAAIETGVHNGTADDLNPTRDDGKVFTPQAQQEYETFDSFAAASQAEEDKARAAHARLLSGNNAWWLSGRSTPYLPAVGAPPLRFQGRKGFDRTTLVKADAFLEMLEEAKLVAEAAAKAAKVIELPPARSSADDKTAGTSAADQKPEAPKASDAKQSKDGEAGDDVTKIETDSGDAVAGTRTRPGGADERPETDQTVYSSAPKDVPLDNGRIVKYFGDSPDDVSQSRVDIPFVLPYQSQPPLVMDSKASLSQDSASNPESSGNADSEK